MKREKRLDAALELRGKVENLAGALGGRAVANADRDVMRHTLEDTIAMAQLALRELGYHEVPLPQEERKDTPRISIISDDAYFAILNFCHAQRDVLFNIDKLREHLSNQGVDVDDATDDELMTYFRSLIPELMADLTSMNGQNVSWLEHDEGMTFYEITPPLESTGGESDGKSNRAQEVEARTGIKLASLLERTASYVARQPGGAIVRKQFTRLVAVNSNLAEGDVHDALTQLIYNGDLFTYREKGKQWLTANTSLADEKRELYREAHRRARAEHRKVRNKERPPVDIDMVENILKVFLAHGMHVQQLLSAKEVWRSYMGDKLDEKGFTEAVRTEINGAAGALAEIGLMQLEKRIPKQGRHSRKRRGGEVQKMGLKSQEIKDYLAKLNAAGILKKTLKTSLNIPESTQ